MSAVEMQATPIGGGEAAAPAAPEEEMARRVARNSLWLIGQPLLLNVLSIVSTGYIARKLGAADYGTFNLGYAQISLFTPLCDLGLSGIAIRAIAQNRDSARRVVGSVFAARLITTGIAALLALLWLLLPTYSLATRLIGMAAIGSMVCQSCGSICLHLFQGFERSKLSAQPLMAGGIIITLLSVAALLAGLGLPGFTAAYVLGAAIQLGLLFRLARRNFFPIRPRWDWQAVRGYLRQTPPFALTDVTARAVEPSSLDVLVLGALCATSIVGPYTAAIGLVARLAVVPWGIVDALYPAVAHTYEADSEGVPRALSRCILYLVLATAPIALCLSFTAPTVLWILFGTEYLGAATALRIAAWLVPLGGAIYLVRVTLAAVHRQNEAARLTVLSGVLTGVLFALLIPRYGMVGAAGALVVRELVTLWLGRGPFVRSFRQAVPWGDLVRGGVALAVMALPLVALSMHYTHLGAILTAAASFLVYGVSLALVGLVDAGGLLARLRPAAQIA